MRLRRWLPQFLRRTLQFGVVVFIVYTAFGGPWRNYKLAHNHRRLVSLIEGDFWGGLYGLNEDMLSLMGEPLDVSLRFLGFPWGARVFGLDTADPTLVAAFALQNGELPLGLLLSLIIPVVTALLLGKVFCSHLCPMRLLFEGGQMVRAGLIKLGAPLPDLRGDQRFGGWVMLGGLTATLVSGTSVWFFILPYVSLSTSLFLWISAGMATSLIAVFLGWFVIDALLAPGYFCHNLCPTGFLLEQLGRRSALKLRKLGEEPCPKSCNLCERTCPYSLKPKEQTHMPACDNCGRCVTACPSDRLRRRLTIVSVALVALGFSLPSGALAHHNKGLPHYGYYENYPQVPTEEYIIIDGRWEMGSTIFNFQGLDRRSADTPNDIKIYLYLYDLDADVGYGGPADFEIRYDGEVVSTFERERVDEEAIYSTRETLPHSGDYEIVALVQGEEVVLPFHVELATDQIDWWLVSGITGPVLILFAIALYGRRRRRRRPRRKASAAAAVALLIASISPTSAFAQHAGHDHHQHMQHAAPAADPEPGPAVDPEPEPESEPAPARPRNAAPTSPTDTEPAPDHTDHAASAAASPEPDLHPAPDALIDHTAHAAVDHTDHAPPEADAPTDHTAHAAADHADHADHAPPAPDAAADHSAHGAPSEGAQADHAAHAGMDHSVHGAQADAEVCAVCGMVGCPGEHYAMEEGGPEVMVMGGIPYWLFLLGVAGIILFSFIAMRWIPARDGQGFRKNLIRKPRLYRIAKSRWLQPLVQLPMVAVLGFLIYAGLSGSQVANITPIAVWTIWWAGLIFAVLFFGAAWCFICPWDGLANLASRLRAVARVEPLSLGLAYPARLNGMYPAILLFVILTWLELGYGVTTGARATAYMGLGMGAMAVAGVLLWDGKKFCENFCPVGRICGMYGNFSPIEIRARNLKVCARCETEDCLHGNESGYACPTGISLKVVEDATMCTMCTECIKSCDKNNVAVNIRPFGADLVQSKPARLDEAWLALMLLALTLFHGLSMTPTWEDFRPGSTSILRWMSVNLGTPRTLNFTLAMALAIAIPVALYWLSCKAASRLVGEDASPRELFTTFAFSLLPVALFYHLAHNLMHLLMEGGAIVPRLSDPLGDGSDYFGTASVHVGSLIAEDTLWYLQVALILVGHLYGVLVAHRIAERRFGPRTRAAMRSLIPITVMMVLISVGGLSLMHLDMNMRVGRM